MRTLSDVRRENLCKLLQDYDSIADFNAAMGKERYNPTFTMIKNESGKTSGRPRRMGKSLAREIEQKLSLPNGWMDEDHAEEVEYLPGEAVSPMKTLMLFGSNPMKKETVHLDNELFSTYFPDEHRDDFAAGIIHDAAMHPTLSSGDRVLVRMDGKFSTDGMYCISTDGGMVIRRVTYRLDGKHVVSADSQPEDKTVLEEIPGISIVGRVCIFWRVTPV